MSLSVPIYFMYCTDTLYTDLSEIRVLIFSLYIAILREGKEGGEKTSPVKFHLIYCYSWAAWAILSNLERILIGLSGSGRRRSTF